MCMPPCALLQLPAYGVPCADVSTTLTILLCVRMQVGSIVNFSLMYLLAPTAAAAAGVGGAAVASQSLIVRALSDEFLVKWGAPGANMFQAGFPVSKRLVNFAYKGFIFSMIGLMAGTVGTSVSNGLLALRKQLDPTFVTQNEPPTVLGNASCWALHMGISSNLRYQVLGGVDGVSHRQRGQTAPPGWPWAGIHPHGTALAGWCMHGNTSLCIIRVCRQLPRWLGPCLMFVVAVGVAVCCRCL
jgi:hypothetical protein